MLFSRFSNRMHKVRSREGKKKDALSLGDVSRFRANADTTWSPLRLATHNDWEIIDQFKGYVTGLRSFSSKEMRRDDEREREREGIVSHGAMEILWFLPYSLFFFSFSCFIYSWLYSMRLQHDSISRRQADYSFCCAANMIDTYTPWLIHLQINDICSFHYLI